MSPTYFHGGVPGLEVGDQVLPPSVTGTPTTADYGAVRVCRRDRIYATTDAAAARVFAALAPFGGGGDVYEVELAEPIDPDGDWHGPANDSVCAPSGTVVQVLERRVDLGVAREALAETILTNATVTVPTKPPRNAPCPCGSGIKSKRCCAA